MRPGRRDQEGAEFPVLGGISGLDEGREVKHDGFGIKSRRKVKNRGKPGRGGLGSVLPLSFSRKGLPPIPAALRYVKVTLLIRALAAAIAARTAFWDGAFPANWTRGWAISFGLGGFAQRPGGPVQIRADPGRMSFLGIGLGHGGYSRNSLKIVIGGAGACCANWVPAAVVGIVGNAEGFPSAVSPAAGSAAGAFAAIRLFRRGEREQNNRVVRAILGIVSRNRSFGPAGDSREPVRGFEGDKLGAEGDPGGVRRFSSTISARG